MNTPRRAIGLLVLANLVGLHAPWVRAVETSDVSHDLFVALRDQDHVAVIDPDVKSVVRTINVGLAPQFIAVSTALNQFIAAQGAQVHVFDLTKDRGADIVLDVSADRFQLSPSGTHLAAIASAEGSIAFVDLATRHEIGRVKQLGTINDVVFRRDGKFIYVGHADGGGVTGIDLEHRKPLLLPLGGWGAVSQLVRAPVDPRLFAARTGSREVSPLNLDGQPNPAPLVLSGRVRDLANTASGRLVLVDDDSGRLTAIDATAFKIVASLSGRSSMRAIYAAWFDMVAFVGVDGSNSLLVYDLDRLERQGDIALQGAPGRGLVTADGAWLFLPIPTRESYRSSTRVCADRVL